MMDCNWLAEYILHAAMFVWMLLKLLTPFGSKNHFESSSSILQRGIRAWAHIKSAIFLALLVLKAILDLSLLTQLIGHPE